MGLNALKLSATTNNGWWHANSPFRKAPVGKSELLCSMSWSWEDNQRMPEIDSQISLLKEIIQSKTNLIKLTESKNQDLLKCKDYRIKYRETKNLDLIKSIWLYQSNNLPTMTSCVWMNSWSWMGLWGCMGQLNCTKGQKVSRRQTVRSCWVDAPFERSK